MTVETGLRVEGALIGDLQLVDGIVVDLYCLLRLELRSGSQTTKGQAHEDAIEPHLIGVDGLMPEHFVDLGAGLVLKLLHHGLHRDEVFLLRIKIVHACDEMTGADVVEVVIEDVVASDLAFLIDHRVGICLTVFPDVLAAIFKIGVEHTFEFNTHHITPFGLSGEIK